MKSEIRSERRGLDRNTLKYIAVAAMLIDHTAAFLLPGESVPYFIMRFIGRITAPIMCMFLAQGFYYTSSRKKYGARLFVFAVISQPAYMFAHGHSVYDIDFNMIFTLFLCFVILCAYEYIGNAVLKWGVIAIITAASFFCDWGIFAPLWVLVLYIFRDDKNKQALSFCLVTCAVVAVYVVLFDFTRFMEAGTLMLVPFIYLYNGKSGKKSKNGFFSKWFFYIIYPLHLVILGLIEKVII